MDIRTRQKHISFAMLPLHFRYLKFFSKLLVLLLESVRGTAIVVFYKHQKDHSEKNIHILYNTNFQS